MKFNITSDLKFHINYTCSLSTNSIYWGLGYKDSRRFYSTQNTCRISSGIDTLVDITELKNRKELHLILQITPNDTIS